MKANSLIRIEQVCSYCEIDLSFIESLHELGHIELIVKSNEHYINEEQLKALESLIYFHNDLDINLAGIDAISHLLKKMEELQNELNATKNKLNLYIKN